MDSVEDKIAEELKDISISINRFHGHVEVNEIFFLEQGLGFSPPCFQSTPKSEKYVTVGMPHPSLHQPSHDLEIKMELLVTRSLLRADASRSLAIFIFETNFLSLEH